MKGSTFRREKIMFSGYFINPAQTRLLKDVAQHPVIRSDEVIAVGGNQQGATRTSHPRVNYHEMNGLSREVRIGEVYQKGSLGNIVAGKVVAEIDDRGLGEDPQDNPFHDPHKGIVLSEVSQQ